MTIEEYEEKCPLSKFIKRVKDESIYKSFESMPKLHSIVQTNNDIIKKIGCGLYSGYNYLSAFPHNKERTDFCNYLNLWLDEQKITHVNNENKIAENEWDLIEELWNNLKVVYGSVRCDRHEEENTLEIKKRIKLMVYCVNRDYFKDVCSRAINYNYNTGSMCSDFSRFTDKYYAKFWIESGCFDDTINPNDHRYYISENCNLHNMSITFPKFDSTSKKIVYDDISRKPIQQCKNTKIISDDGASLDNNPAFKVDGQAAPVRAETTSSLGETVSEHSRSDSTQLAPPSQIELTLTENGTSKTIYYTGLSTLGVVFSSMVLYKV
ncbi:hypothetical protein PVMG_05944 [Plasmodium vivax Mauritania I]|uniref:Variable surface protein Vir24 n=1 Tax=Plasmodium vivax Mauritania I TaxID=1035515 RepID=A0A0J9THK6_PLAVI|nr:hypothetical protein PVMG_05944 [Plasmodium vivax Mauritania I]